MIIPRRKFLQFAIGSAMVPAVGDRAMAETYPAHPARILVGFGPGGAPDILGRLIGQQLSDRLGQPFVVENKPGAAGNIATEAVVHAPADGYTLLLVSLSNAVNATLYDKLGYNFMQDIAPVGGISRDPDVMLVNPSFAAKTVPEFIAYAKDNPGKINMASPGVGTSPHMAGELFKVITGIEMTHVAYHSSPAAFTDLLGGQVQVYFGPISASLDFIRSGRLRALGVTTAKRADLLPDVPAIGEFVPTYEVTAWYGIGAPANTPAEVVNTLARSLVATLADPAFKTKLTEIGSAPFAISPAEFAKFIGNETEKWAKVIKADDIKPE